MRVEVSAKFASMPTRTSVHTRTVNSTPGMWDMFHLIRFICEAKGLLSRGPGHMGAHPSARASRNGIEHGGVFSPYRDLYGVRPPPWVRLRVKVYADLNTFRTALVPQSE